jgi:integrase
MPRPRGFGQTFQRHGHWWIRWYAGGSERRESVAKVLQRPAEQITEKAARALLKARLAEKMAGGVRPVAQGRRTVSELLDAYWRSRQLRVENGQHAGRLRSQLELVREWFGAERAIQLTRQRIEEIAEAARTRGFVPRGAGRSRVPYALSTIKARLNLLHAVLAHAQDHDMISAVPAMPTIVVHNARRGLIEPAQLEAIVRGLPAPLDEIARFGWLTGWRASECRDLTWEHVDLTRGVVQYWPGETKSKAGRVRPLEPTLIALLERRHKARALGCPYVFHRHGRRVPASTFNDAWRRARQVAGCPKAIFHDFRRTLYADFVGAAGGDLLAAMELVGHQSLATAKRYNVMELQRMRGAVAKLTAYREAAAALALSHNSRTNEIAIQ